MKRQNWAALSILMGIVLIGAILRIAGLYHGIGAHPDERHMVMVTLDLQPSFSWINQFPYFVISGMNPKSFAYGSFPYYLNRLVAEGAALIFTNAMSYDGLFICGRVICIFFAVLSIPLLYFLTKHTIDNRGVALMSSAFLALNVLHIQLSKFFTVDVMLTMLTLAAVLAAVKYLDSGKLLYLFASAVLTGLSIGTKISGSMLLAPIFVAIFLRAAKERKLISLKFPLLIIVVSIISLAVFVTVEPYAILDHEQFYRQVAEQMNMARGKWRPPYTIQYVGTMPFIYPLQQMFFYTMGWPLALSVFCGFVMAVALQVSRPFLTKMDERLKINYDAALLLLVWIIAIYGTTAGLMVKYPRYLIPIYPQLFVFAAIFLFWCGVKLSNFYQRDRG